MAVGETVEESQDIEELLGAARDAKAEVDEAFEDDDDEVIVEAAREFFRLLEAIEDHGGASEKDLVTLQTTGKAFMGELKSRDIGLDDDED